MQGGLLLRRWESPRGARAALLTEDEAQLLRRLQLSLMGTERRAGLRQIERAEEVDVKVAFLTTHLARGPGGLPLDLLCLYRHRPPVLIWIERQASDQSSIPEGVKGC